MTASEPARTDGPGGSLFEERLSSTRRSWAWLGVVVVITFFAIGPVFAPVAAAAWIVNVVRYRRAFVRVDADALWVGKRSVRLAALDLDTLDRAGNTWPWRGFSSNYLGANPIWTSDSVGVRGIDGSRPYWVAVGTNRRDELVSALRHAVPAAQERVGPARWASPTSALPPPGWHPDPWDPETRLRWWDGGEWSGYTWPRAAPPPGGQGGSP